MLFLYVYGGQVLLLIYFVGSSEILKKS